MYAGGSKLNKDGRNGSYAKWTAVVCLALIVICGAVKSVMARCCSQMMTGSRYSLYYSVGLFSLIVCLIGSFLDRLFREIRENADLEAYKKIAFTDLMTGMRNRSAFKTDAAAWNDEPRGKLCTCIVFDVNNLKEINDTYGHFAGDRENAGRENEISFAYGYATGEVASAADFSRLCEKADENMYRQKEEMKNA